MIKSSMIVLRPDVKENIFRDVENLNFEIP